MQIILRLGDLTTAEVAERCAGDAAAMLASLSAQGRIVELPLPGGKRWVAAEEQELYARLDQQENAQRVLRRYLQSHGPVSRSVLLGRYGLRPEALQTLEQAWAHDRQMVRGRFQPPPPSGPAEDMGLSATASWRTSQAGS